MPRTPAENDVLSRPRKSRSKKKKASSTLDKITEVRTGYARLALMLVLANLFLTGYVVSRISSLQSEAETDVLNLDKPTATPSEPTGGGI